jgi:hypothetical protein
MNVISSSLQDFFIAGKNNQVGAGKNSIYSLFHGRVFYVKNG